MLKLLTILPLASLALVGCGPSPAGVCSKLQELNAKPPACEIKWQMAKAEDKEKFTKNATCVMNAKTKADLSSCD